MKTFASLALALVLAACGGTPNTPGGSTVNYGGGGPKTGPGSFVEAGVVVTIPNARAHRHGRYVSPATQSISIQAASANGGPVTGVTASTIDTVPGAPGCSAQGSGLRCHGTVEAVAGADVFNVTTFAWKDANGPVLSAGTVNATISGASVVNINDDVALTLDGIVAKLRLTLAPSSAHEGKATTSQVALTAYDAAGEAIVGKSAYQSPLQLSIQGDVAGAFQLRAGKNAGSALTIAGPLNDIALRYDGNPNAASVTLLASVAGGGTGAPSADAPFTISGTPPPPKGGPICALNAGANSGRGATVTVYAADATGNAAPSRTLSLSSTLYAQSIAVDSKGLLYVGYFDNSLGFDPGTHLPDDGNVVAVYAADATGNAKPVSILTADAKTGSALFPSTLAFDPSGDLVTFGATTVAGSPTDSVLVYSALSGAQAPAHAWNFASPAVSFPGVAGIALDAGGNFYVNGALHTTLGPNNGVFVALQSDEDNPSANVSRDIPWDAATHLTSGATAVSIDGSGEIYVANPKLTSAGSTTTCTAQVNAFAAGSTGGTTDVPPLRVISIAGFSTTDPRCSTSGNALAATFPAALVYGTSIYAASDFTNALAVFPANASGNVTPAQAIAGSATHLDVPVAIAVGPATPAGARAATPSTPERKRP